MSPAERAARERIGALTERARAASGAFSAWMLFRREIKRFLTIVGQSVFSPVLTTMLYFLVFGYSLGSRLREVDGIPYMDFLTPGLVMMAVITNSFMNAAFSFFINKIHGAIVDLLAAPISSLQLMAAYVGASLMRALLTGGIIWAIAAAFGAGTLYNPAITLAFMVLTSAAFSLFGLASAVVSEEFEHVNFVPSFLVMPFVFLGGVFYSIEMLPEPWGKVALFNPFLYLVNGLRYGMAGVSDVPVTWSFAVGLASFAVFLATAWLLLASGRKLRE